MSQRFSLLLDDEEEGVFNPFTPPAPSAQPSPQAENNPAPATDNQLPAAQDPATDSQVPPAQDPASPQENTPPPPSQQPSQEPMELLVCAGAKCVCDKAVSPAPVELQVVSQRKYFINDADSSQKLIATTAENNVLALNFKQCKVPNPNQPSPCQPQLEWKDFYAGVEAGGVKVLTEKSTAICKAKGGKITIQTHGQQMAITTRELAQADASNWTATNPLVGEQDVDILESDADGENTDGAGVAKIAPVTMSPARGEAHTYPPGTTVEFKVKKYSPRSDGSQPTAAQKAAIDWVVYDGDARPILMKSDVGPVMHTTFNKVGDYIVEAYGKRPGKISDNREVRDKAATYRISIRANALTSVRVGGARLVRVNEVVVFKTGLRFDAAATPLRGAPLSATTWKQGHCLANASQPTGALTELLDETLRPRTGEVLRHSFESPGRHVVIATLNGEQKQSGVVEVIENYVQSVKAEAASVRVGDELYLAAHYRLDPPTAEEKAPLQWQCLDAAGHTLGDFNRLGQVRRPYRFAKEGRYTVYAYLGRGEKAKIEVEVVRPIMTHAYWQGSLERGRKTLTGWGESSRLMMVFKACQGLKVELRVYGHTRAGVVELERLEEKTIPDTNQLEHSFVLRQELASKLKAEDRLSFGVVVKTPGYSIGKQMQDDSYLTIVEREQILKLGFYLNGKAVMGVNYGDVLQGRVQARNLVGKTVKVAIYRVERRMSQDWLRLDTSLVEQTCTIGESGWGAFDFSLPEGEKSSYNDTIHYFRAYVVDQSWFGSSMTVGEAASGSELPAVSNTSVLLFARKDSTKGKHQPQFVGIQRSGDRQKREDCTRCTAKLTKAELTKMFPKLKDDKDLFALTKDRYKNKNITLPDYTLDSFVSELNKTLEEFQINTCRRKAAFLAQLAQETGDFAYMVEHISKDTANLNYEHINGNGSEESGDGFKYRGRGLIQITGRSNYKRFNEFVGKNYLEEPDEMLKSLPCLVRSAGWFWQHGQTLKSRYVDINLLADCGNFRLISRLIQGGETTVVKRRAKLATINPVIFEDGQCKAEKTSTQPGVEMHIYQEGKIEKLVPKADTETYLVRYYYHDKDGGKHFLGISDFHKTDWRASSSSEQKKDKDGNVVNYAELIDFRSLISYSSGNVKFKFIPGSLGKDNRFYVDIDAFACLLGAMIEESIEDLAFNGFSKVDGDTAAGSVSHKNGMIGDVRYLSKNKNGEITWLFISATNTNISSNFDYERQVKLNNALYKFGFAQYGNLLMLSENFVKGGQTTLLPHTKHYVVLETNTRHYHHLHLQGLKLSAVIKVKSK